MQPRDDWALLVDLIERVVSDAELLPAVVVSVRTTVRDIGALPSADVASHTRALLIAATRAIAARRRPTEAELSFVAELGITRASQGVPLDAVLSAIHVAERAIWSRARQVAAQQGVSTDLLLDARELYDDWSDAVRARLTTTHRATEVDRHLPAANRDASLLRRLLESGSAAELAAAEAGLPAGERLWVLVARPYDSASAAARERTLRAQGPAVVALIDGLLVGVLTRVPAPAAFVDGAVAGLAGPADPEQLGAARRLASAALVAAEAVGRTGLVHIAGVTTLAAVVDRADLAAVLVDRHRPAWTALGSNAQVVARGVCAWLEADRDFIATAAILFVHPNTIRNRLQRFMEVTGIDPHTTFGAVDAWWLCRTWLTHDQAKSH